MVFILGKKELLLESKFYEPQNNWDYPLEELDHLIKDAYNPDMIYVVCDDKRIYETNCENYKINELYNDLKEDIKLRKFELAKLSVLIKIYVNYGLNAANENFKKWKEDMKELNPNIDEIEKDFNFIVEPLKTKRLKLIENSKKFDFEHLNNYVFDYCNQHIGIAKEFIEQFEEYIEQLENQEEMEE